MDAQILYGNENWIHGWCRWAQMMRAVTKVRSFWGTVAMVTASSHASTAVEKRQFPRGNELKYERGNVLLFPKHSSRLMYQLIQSSRKTPQPEGTTSSEDNNHLQQSLISSSCTQFTFLYDFELFSESGPTDLTWGKWVEFYVLWRINFQWKMF